MATTFSEASQGPGYIWRYDAGTAAWTNIATTSRANFDIFTDDFEADDAIYFGFSLSYSQAIFFWGLFFNVATAIAADAYELVWEYPIYSAATWSSITPIGDDTEMFSKIGQYRVGWHSGTITNWYNWLSLVGSSTQAACWCRCRVVSVTNPTEGGHIGAGAATDYPWVQPYSSVIITGTGQSFSTAYVADKATTRTLMDRTNAGDGTAMYPSMQIQSPASKGLILNIGLSGSSAGAGDTIDLVGTDSDGNAVTESIDVSGGDATYTSHPLYKLTTLTCNGFADGNVDILQNGWGAVDKIGALPASSGEDAIYYILNSSITVGNNSTTTAFAHTDTLAIFRTDIQMHYDRGNKYSAQCGGGQCGYFGLYGTGVTFTGGVVDATTTFGYNGGDFVFCDATGWGNDILTTSGSTMNWYGGVARWNAGGDYESGSTIDWKDIYLSSSGRHRAKGTGQNYTRVKWNDWGRIEYYPSGGEVVEVEMAGTVNNPDLWGNGIPYTATRSKGWLMTAYNTSGTVIADDCDFAFYLDAHATGKMKIRYGFIPLVVDYQGNPISGATIDLKDRNGTAADASSAPPWTTGADGKIATTPQVPYFSVTGTTTCAGSYNTSSTTSEKRGVKITVGASDVILHYAYQHTSATATTAYITDSSLNTLATATFKGYYARFDYLLSANTTYYVLADKGGASYTSRYNSVAISFPEAETLFSYVAGYAVTGGDSSTTAYTIQVLQMANAYSPYTAIVRAAGKETQRIEGIPLDQKTAMTIRLRDSVSPGRDEQGDEFR